jgi:hypothetical protein
MSVSLGNMYAVKEIWNAVRGLIPSSAKEVPLEQQMASGLIPSYDDEAISAALDAALVQHKGPTYLTWIKAVRAILKPHQRERWRKVYGTIKLTERHEDVLSSKKHTKVEASAKGAAREDTTEEYQRRQRDYEYTKDDPRLQHLIIVAEMVRDHSAEAAKVYLISSDFALEKSLAEQTKEKLDELKTAAGKKLTAASYSLFLGSDRYDEVVNRNTGKPQEVLEKDLSDALVSKTARDRRELKQAKRDRILHAKPKALGIIIGLMAAMIAAMSLIQFLK